MSRPRNPGRLVNTQVIGPPESLIQEVGWGLRICIADNFPDTDAASLGTLIWVPLCSTPSDSVATHVLPCAMLTHLQAWNLPHSTPSLSFQLICSHDPFLGSGQRHFSGKPFLTPQVWGKGPSSPARLVTLMGTPPYLVVRPHPAHTPQCPLIWAVSAT